MLDTCRILSRRSWLDCKSIDTLRLARVGRLRGAQCTEPFRSNHCSKAVRITSPLTCRLPNRMSPSASSPPTLSDAFAFLKQKLKFMQPPTNPTPTPNYLVSTYCLKPPVRLYPLQLVMRLLSTYLRFLTCLIVI